MDQCYVGITCFEVIDTISSNEIFCDMASLCV